MPLDDELAAQIQSFTSWAASRGYHLIGALISPKEKPNVRIFCTSPDKGMEQQKEHLLKLADIFHYTVHKGKSTEVANLPLGNN